MARAWSHSRLTQVGCCQHPYLMSALVFNEAGGYDFLEGIEPYSSGVVAREGFEVVHLTLDKLLHWPMALRGWRNV